MQSSSSSQLKISGGEGKTSKYEAACRYWKYGTCKMGDHCRFNHSEPQDPLFILHHSLSSSSSSTSTSRPFDLSSSSSSSIHSSRSNSFSFDSSHLLPFDSSSFFFNRKPFVHVILLYAGGVGVLTVPPHHSSLEGKVSLFAREVCHCLSLSSIDYFFHSKMNSTHFIRTENLSEIIGHFKADHLIVIGDRNMKNRTIQVRRRAKLIEMGVEEAIQFIWNQVEMLQDPSTSFDIYDLLEKYCGIRHYKERIEKLKLEVEEFLLAFHIPSNISSCAMGMNKGTGGNYNNYNMKGRMETNNQQMISLNEKATLKLNQIQKTIIRYHQQLSEAAEKMEGEEEGKISKRGIEILDANMNSNHLLPPLLLSSHFHSILYLFLVKKLLAQLELVFIQKKLSPFAHLLFLWNNYFQDYSSLPPPSSPSPLYSSPPPLFSSTPFTEEDFPSLDEKKNSSNPSSLSSSLLLSEIQQNQFQILEEEGEENRGEEEKKEGKREWECKLCNYFNAEEEKKEISLRCKSCYHPFSTEEEEKDKEEWFIVGRNYRKALRQRREKESNLFKSSLSASSNSFPSTHSFPSRRTSCTLPSTALHSSLNLAGNGSKRGNEINSWTEGEVEGNEGRNGFMNERGGTMIRSHSMGTVNANAWIHPPAFLPSSFHSKSQEWNSDPSFSAFEYSNSSSSSTYSARGVKSLDSVPMLVPYSSTPSSPLDSFGSSFDSSWDRDEIYGREMLLQEEYANDFSHFSNHADPNTMMEKAKERKGLKQSQGSEGMEIDQLLSLAPSPTKPFSDLWSSSSSANSSYLSLPSADFEYSLHDSNYNVEEQVSSVSPAVSSPSLRLTDQGIHLLLRETEDKNSFVEQHDFEKDANQLSCERPCSYCGQEASIECTFCARSGLPSTFFCSTEHQSLLWKQHSKEHYSVTPSLIEDPPFSPKVQGYLGYSFSSFHEMNERSRMAQMQPHSPPSQPFGYDQSIPYFSPASFFPSRSNSYPPPFHPNLYQQYPSWHLASPPPNFSTNPWNSSGIMS